MATKTGKRYEQRTSSQVLLVSGSRELAAQLRIGVKALGYSRIVDVSSHGAGIERIKALSQGRSFAFVIYDARSTDISAHAFTRSALQLEPDLVLIPASSQPHIDDVFGLLQAGSRSFLAIPFTSDSIHTVVERALDGPPFSEAVLKSRNRNSALVAMMLHCLYRLSVVLRQDRLYRLPTTHAQIQKYRTALHETSELARLYCINGDKERLRAKIIEHCIARANTAASRLGRTRRKLRHSRAS